MYVNMMNYTNVSDLWIECNAQSAFIFCQNKFNFSDLWWFSAGDKQVWKKEPLPFPSLWIAPLAIPFFYFHSTCYGNIIIGQSAVVAQMNWYLDTLYCSSYLGPKFCHDLVSQLKKS